MEISHPTEVRLKKSRETQYGLMVGLQMTQSILERVRGMMKPRDVLIESLRETARQSNMTERGGGGAGKEDKTPAVQNLRSRMLLWLCTAVYVRVLDKAQLETSGLCFGWESVAWSWKNRIKTGEGSTFAARESEMAPRCSLRLASEMKPFTLWREQGSDKFLKYVVHRKTLEKIRE